MGSTCSKGKGNDQELVIKDYRQTKILIASYTKGLKTQLKEVMTQSNVGGSVTKRLYEDRTESYSTPIHTEVICGGTESAVNEFKDLVKEVVEEGVDFDFVDFPEPEMSEKEKAKPVIKPPDKIIINRKGP